MKILITGGAGYIGGTMVRTLLKAGHQVTIYDNLSHSRRESAAEGTDFILGDIADRVLLESTLRAGRFDGVMHFAAFIEAGDSMKHPEIYFRNNTAGTLSLLESMLATGHDRLIFSSTAACYGEPEKTPIAEDAKLYPTNAYGESKLMIEQMLRWFHQIHGLRYASLRYFNAAGAIPGHGEAHVPETHIIPIVLDVALGKRESISVFGNDYPTKDGTCVRDYIHVQDLADAHILALEAISAAADPAAAARTYNIGNGSGFSVLEVIDSVRRVTGHPVPVVTQPRRPGDPATLVASSDKIKRELGWSPKFADLDSIIRSAWEWHKGR